MQNETIIAGFGGQGVLFIGKVMSYAALENDLEVTWFPSYGPEMRGGTANCTVVILVVNTSLVNRPVKRKDISAIEIPATKIAEEIGDKRYANVVLLGGLAAAADFLDIKYIEKGLKKSLTGKKEPLFEINLTALHKGADYK